MADSNKRKRVLVVDDERNVADTLVAIFSLAEYEAIAAYSAEEALQLLESWVPQKAILDVHLPAMNGVDLAIHLKAEYPSIKLTLFSGQATTTELLEAARADGHSFDILAKPVHPTELLRLLASDVTELPSVDHRSS